MRFRRDVQLRAVTRKEPLAKEGYDLEKSITLFLE